MQTTNSQPQTYEEIDLVELVLKIYKFFKKRILLILLVTLVCVGIGVLGSFVVFQPRYQTTMIFQSRSMTASEVVGVVGTLNNLAREENYEEMQKLTGLPREISKYIVKLEAAPNREIQKNIEKDIRRDSTLALTIETLDNENLDKIQQGLVSYFESLPYVQKHKQIFKEGNERVLAQIQQEIKHLDSLKKIVESSIFIKNSFILNTSGDISKKIIELREKENEVRKELAFPDDIKVIKGFTRYQKPRKFSIRDTLWVSAFVGLILGILCGLIIELNKLIRKREQGTA
ncbi:MAG: hypothetical protein NZ516_04910 [Raineya sp.]|nr:hypothetical protein [Raineya sp.]